jgi:protein tyrosine/serine phosphatase
MPCRRGNDDWDDIVCKDELLIIRAVKQEYELMLGMIQHHSSDDFVGKPAYPF